MAIQNINFNPKPEKGISYSVITDTSADWSGVSNDTYFYDLDSNLPYYKNASGTVIAVFEEGGSSISGGTYSSGTLTLNDDGGSSVSITGVTGQNFANADLDFTDSRIHQMDSLGGSSRTLTIHSRSNATTDRYVWSYNNTVGGPKFDIYNRFSTKIFSIGEDSNGNAVGGVTFTSNGLDVGVKRAIEMRPSSSPTSYIKFSNQFNSNYTQIGANVPHYFLASSGALSINKFIIGNVNILSNEDISLQGNTLINGELIQQANTSPIVDSNLINDSFAFHIDSGTLAGRYKDNLGIVTDLSIGTTSGSNLGGGEAIFSGKSGVDLQFKTLTSTGSSVTISSTGATVNLESVPPTLSKTFTLDAPTASDDVTVFRTDVAITVQEVIAVSVGSSPSTTYQLKHHPTRSNAGNNLTTSSTTTSTGTGDTATLSDATIPANSWIWFESTAASGTNVVLTIDIRYTED